MATCILVGLAPAIGIARSEQQSTLKQSGRGTTSGRASQRARQGIVAAEVAAALILLAGAWLMASSLRNLTNVDPGFDPSNVLTVRLFLPSSKYNAAQAERFYRAALERVASLPGVKSVTVGTDLPLHTNNVVRFDRDGSARAPPTAPALPMRR